MFLYHKKKLEDGLAHYVYIRAERLVLSCTCSRLPSQISLEARPWLRKFESQMLGTVYRSRPRALNSVSRAACATYHAPYSQLHGQKDLGIAPAPPTGPKVIFSGIQPTGVPHLGNYLGALQQWIRLQDTATPDTKLLFSVVDLHALTVRQDREQLQRWKRETLAALLAVGLDPERCIIFFQSDVC